MAEDLVDRLESHMGRQDITVLLRDCRAAAVQLRQQAASLVAKDSAIRLLDERCAQYERRAEQAERALAEAVEVIKYDIGALNAADAQIEYLHDKFKPTGSGVSVLGKIDIAATAARAFVAQHGSDSREGK